MDLTVNYCGIDFDVVADFIPAELDTNSKHQLDNCIISINGIDMYEILSQKQITEIENLAIENYLDL